MKKKALRMFMEVYAGYLEYTDFEIGRLVNHLNEIQLKLCKRKFERSQARTIGS
jgi:hypothetical protein